MYCRESGERLLERSCPDILPSDSVANVLGDVGASKDIPVFGTREGILIIFRIRKGIRIGMPLDKVPGVC